MSTPIQSLPLTNDVPVTAVSNESDPMVQDIMKDIEAEVANATAQVKSARPYVIQNYVHPMPSSLSSMQSMQSMQPLYSMQSLSFLSLNMSVAHKSAIVALVCLLIYSDNFLALYEKIPKLKSFQAYDLFIRAFMVALIVYITYIKFNL